MNGIGQIVNSPRGSTVREQLAKEVATFDVVYGSQPVVHLFWNRTFELLRWMDVVCSDHAVRALHVNCPPSWVAWATMHALQYNNDVDVQDITAMQQLALRVLLLVEQRRRRWELQRCDTSLRDVTDLLDTPNMAPFLCDHRTQATHLRVLLRGGVRMLFGYEFRHVTECPWCGYVDTQGLTVPHLLRDCTALEPERVCVWETARDVLVAAGKCVHHDVTEHRQHWYVLTCGGAVPNTFVRLHLDAPTHFARGEHVAATRHMRHNLRLYRRVLGITAKFLCLAVLTTQQQLESRFHELQQRDPLHKRRVLIRHRSREAAVLCGMIDSEFDVLRDGTQQSQQSQQPLT